jgi:hypothetical protein
VPTVDHYRKILREAYGGRHWLLAFDVLASTTSLVSTLHELGALDLCVIGASRGTGATPDPAFASQQHELGVTGATMMDGIRQALRALADVPPSVQAAVDAWDPTGEVRAIGTLFDPGTPVAGRRKYGARRPEWCALEDKIAIEALWAELDVPRAPHRVVPAEPGALDQAHRALDRGLGTVWAGDNREGWHGGAEYTRWVRTGADAESALAVLGPACDEVRVMPFIEGIPCSIHGIVFPDYVVALRPCEMVVLRRTDITGLLYARASTFWDPPPADRNTMRALAKRVGAHLRDTLGFRGAFTIDGILSEEGFVPTELNPRYGAALGVMSASLPGLSTLLLNLAVVEGEHLDWQPRALERLLLAAADRNRAGSIGAVTATPRTATETAALVDEGDGWRLAADGEAPHAVARVGPATAGSYCGATFSREHTPVGASLAPRAASLLGVLNELWGLGLPPLGPARVVRR